MSHLPKGLILGPGGWQSGDGVAVASFALQRFKSTGVNYQSGFYDMFTGNNNFSVAVNFGSINRSEAAHFFVVLGAATVNQLTLRITGTSITDGGVRTPADTEDIVIPNATPINSYFETSKKWLGQISIVVVGGTAQQCNYGWCKYFDDWNNDFTIKGIEAVWSGGANDASPNIKLIHHKNTGWTYNVGAKPTPPTSLVNMNTDHTPDIVVVSSIPGAWKRDNLNQLVRGSLSEGVIIEIDINNTETFRTGYVALRYTPGL